LYWQCLSQPPMRRLCIVVVAVLADAVDAVLSSKCLPTPLMPR
jgi:hypothetical protein